MHETKSCQYCKRHATSQTMYSGHQCKRTINDMKMQGASIKTISLSELT